MKSINLLAVALAFTVVACSDATMDEPVELVTVTRSVTDDVPMLSFGSLSEFNNVVDTLAAFKSDNERLDWMKQHYADFYSLQNAYYDAMDAAGELGETEDEYNAFKEQFSMLYFPMEREDAGFYIPMQDLNKAFLVNASGNVKIAGQIINMKDINNYETLMELGRAYYTLPQVTMYAGVEYFGLNQKVDPVGSEYDSGWAEYGKRKVKLKLRKRIDNYVMLFHTEFCFRKKTWIGWINYSAGAVISGTVKDSEGSLVIPVNSASDHASSHDRDYTLGFFYVKPTGLYYVPSLICDITVNYNDVATPLKYHHEMLEARYNGQPNSSTGPFGPITILNQYL